MRLQMRDLGAETPRATGLRGADAVIYPRRRSLGT